MWPIMYDSINLVGLTRFHWYMHPHQQAKILNDIKFNYIILIQSRCKWTSTWELVSKSIVFLPTLITCSHSKFFHCSEIFRLMFGGWGYSNTLIINICSYLIHLLTPTPWFCWTCGSDVISHSSNFPPTPY